MAAEKCGYEPWALAHLFLSQTRVAKFVRFFFTHSLFNLPMSEFRQLELKPRPMLRTNLLAFLVAPVLIAAKVGSHRM